MNRLGEHAKDTVRIEEKYVARVIRMKHLYHSLENPEILSSHLISHISQSLPSVISKESVYLKTHHCQSLQGYEFCLSKNLLNLRLS